MLMNLNPYLMLFAGGAIVKDELTHLGIKTPCEVSMLVALTNGHQQSMLLIESEPT